MFPSYLLCFVQISSVSVLAIILARAMLPRSPSLSARLAGLGIALSLGIAVASLVPVARPWHIDLVGRWVDVPTDTEGTMIDTRARRPVARNREDLRSEVQNSGVLRLLAFSIDGSNATVKRDNPAHGFIIVIRVMLVTASLTVLVRVATGLRAIGALHRTSLALDDRANDPRFGEIAARANLRRAPEIRKSSRIHSPCVTWLKPNIVYVPTSFAEWSNEEQDASMAHELAHLMNRDALHRAWATLCGELLWFHPCVRVLRRHFKLAQELAADQQAATILGDTSRYARGLSRLALRLDSQTSSSRFSHTFLVSVSAHDMIRRITMLNSMDGSRTRRLTYAGYLSVTLLLGLSIAATCFADDEAPVARVASRAIQADAPLTAAKPFSGPSTEPWKAVGAGHGYFMFRPSQFAQHRVAQSVVSDISEGVLRGAALPEIGLSFDNVELFQCRVAVSVSDIPKTQQTDGKKHSLQVGGDAFDLRSHRPINWTVAADAIHFAAIAPEESAGIQRVREMFGNRGLADHMRIISAKQTEIDSRTTSRLHRIWKHVDGGTFSVAVAPNDEFSESMLDGRAESVLSAAEIMGIGVDFGDPDKSVYNVRIAFVPRADRSADDLISLIGDSPKTIVAGAAAQNEGRANSLLARIASDMRSWKLRVEAGPYGDDVVIVEGPVSRDTFVALIDSM